MFLSHCPGQQLPRESQGKWIPTTNLTSSESPPTTPCQEGDKVSSFAPSPCPFLPSPWDLLVRPHLSTQQAFTSPSLRETEAGSRKGLWPARARL